MSFKSEISNLRFQILAALLATAFLCPPLRAAERRWENGFPDRPDFFPLCVWVQNVRNAERYKAIGVNTYVSLCRGRSSCPTRRPGRG